MKTQRFRKVMLLAVIMLTTFTVVGQKQMIRKHIPEHNQEAIIQSLRSDLNAINYTHLNVDKPGLKLIMDLALESRILHAPVDIESFAEESFSTEITLK